MDYSALNHKFHFICRGRYTSDKMDYLENRPGWKVHIDNWLLCCDTSKLHPRVRRDEAVCEIFIDLRATSESGILQVYLYAGQWDVVLKDIDEVNLCKLCTKRLFEYVKSELRLPPDELNKLLTKNQKEIEEAFSIPEDNRQTYL